MVDFTDLAEPVGEAVQADIILKYLTSMNMGEHEAEFRTWVDVVAGENYEGPMLRIFVIAMIAVLMLTGGVRQTYILKVVNVLKTRSDAELQEDAVAFINGSDLLVPSNADPGIAIYNLNTMRQAQDLPEYRFVSVMYSVRDVWAQAASVLDPPKKK